MTDTVDTSYQNGSGRDMEENVNSDMKENVNLANVMISFAADRVQYLSIAQGTRSNEAKNNIPIDVLEGLFPGIKQSYRLTNKEYNKQQLQCSEGDPCYNVSQQPGLDQGCDKGHETASCTRGLACGLVNAIFYREWRMKQDNSGTFRDGNGGYPTKYVFVSEGVCIIQLCVCVNI